MSSETKVWWVRYREKAKEPIQVMNKEMLLRTSVGAAWKEYFKNLSLCGANYVVDTTRSFGERLFWLILILLAEISVVTVVYHSWCDFVAKPIIVTLESQTHPIEEIPFPAVSLCTINRISQKSVEEYAKKLHPVANYSMEELKNNINQLGRLLDYNMFGYNDLLPFIKHIHSVPDPDGYSFVKRIKMLTPKCEDILYRCYWNDEERDCMEIFNFRRTVNGYCCNFNYVREREAVQRHLLDDRVERQVVAGQQHGLLVAMHSRDDDYGYSLHNIVGVEVLIYDATTYADPASAYVSSEFVRHNDLKFVVIESTTVDATDEVRKYSADTRGCRFPDELISEFSGLYSYTSCFVTCRIRTVISLCKCVPYYLPYYGEAPYCTLLDLPCLDKHREKLLYVYPWNTPTEEGLELESEDSLECHECLPDCTFTRHSVRSFQSVLQESDNFKYLLTHNVKDKLNKSVFLLYHEARETTLYRMDVVYYWYELISNLGGLASVFVGYSIMTYVEFIYFSVFRFLFILTNNIKKYT